MAALKIGAWYLCARCVKCTELIPYIAVNEDATIGGDDSVSVEMPCNACGTQAPYRLSQMEKVQVTAGVPPDVTRH